MSDAGNTTLHLWRAVIAQAIGDATSDAQGLSALKARHRARQWFKFTNQDFAEVCALAGLDPSAVQTNALALIAEADATTGIKVSARGGKAKLYTDANGVTLSLREWGERYGLSAPTIRNRLNRGMSLDQALATSLGTHGPKRSKLPEQTHA